MPAVKQRLQTIAALAAQVKDAPGGKGPLEKKHVRIEIIGESWLQDPEQSSSSEGVDLHSTLLSLCKGYVTNQTVTDDSAKYLEECSKLEYVAVVRTRSFTKPTINMQAKSYDPGKFSGEVLVFSLPKGELSASYSVEATNSEELELDEKNPHEGHWYRQAMADLSSNAKSAVEKALAGGPAESPGGW
jgi:hypothetical protein